jgi:protein-disulfide isomerase
MAAIPRTTIVTTLNDLATGQGQGQQNPPQKFSINDIKTDGLAYIGNAQAPVTIVYWTDFQCPFCKKIEMETMPNVVKNYVATNKVKIVFKDFQFLGPDSMTAATYAHSIWKLYPAQYYAWREAMFAAQDAENAGFGNEASVKTLTQKVAGIDVQKVIKDVAQNRSAYETAVVADVQEAQQKGIRGTPALLVGETLIPGAVSYNELKPLLDELLKR